MTIQHNADRNGQTKITFRLPDDIIASIEAFMAKITSEQQQVIDAASVMKSGKPHRDSITAFIVWAIRSTLAKANPTPTLRVFGNEIEKTVTETMERNIKAYKANEWWNITAIGSSFLRQKHNPHSVKRWLDDKANVERITEHHRSVGVDDPLNHNRKAGKARAKMSSQIA